MSGEERELLLSAQRKAMDMLAASSAEAERVSSEAAAGAAALSETKTGAAVDILMAGQRETAAILLAAWMQVMEGRPPAGKR